MTASLFRLSIVQALLFRWNQQIAVGLLLTLISVSIVIPQYCAGAESAAPVLLVLGDSLSAGYGLKKEEGWVTLLKDRIAREKFDYNVVNASISGETTAGGLSRLPELLKRYHPSVVVIALGANDGLRGLPLPAMRNQLTGMIKFCKAIDARVMLVGVEIPPNYGASFVHDFTASFVMVAKDNHVPLVASLFAGFETQTDMFQGDNYHPNATAQSKILDNIWPTLRTVLSSRRVTAVTLSPNVT
jgi:acyl-CoA thioesterase-1